MPFRFQVPWEALRALLGQSVYGGRVDSIFDQQLLEGFVSALFQPRSFDLNFPLCRYVETSFRCSLSSQQLTGIPTFESVSPHWPTHLLSQRVKVLGAQRSQCGFRAPDVGGFQHSDICASSRRRDWDMNSDTPTCPPFKPPWCIRRRRCTGTPLCSTHETGSGQASALVTLPDATSPDAFMKWANSLPASNPPTWLGLAPNAEAALLATRGEQLLSKWQVGCRPGVDESTPQR